MRTVLVLLACLGGACAFANIDDKIIRDYGGLALMRDCFGEDIFKHFLKEVRAAMAFCRDKAVEPSVGSSPAEGEKESQQMDIMFDRAHVHKLSVRMRLASSNYTCVQQQLGYIDDSYNIQYENIIKDIKEVGRFDERLMEDLLASINQCRDFTTCVPLDNIQFPMPPDQMKYLNFKNCFDLGSIRACVKKQFRNKEPDYDFMGAQNIFDSSTADEKLISILWRHTSSFF